MILIRNWPQIKFCPKLLIKLLHLYMLWITGRCQCTTVNTTLTIVSSVATFILGSFLCLICCGILNCVIWRRISNQSKAASNQDTGPIYDDIASTTVKHNTKLELEDNKAYAKIAAKWACNSKRFHRILQLWVAVRKNVELFYFLGCFLLVLQVEMYH